jgi:long-chain fatty acid transport protein
VTLSFLRRRSEQINSYLRTGAIVSSNQRYLLGNIYITDDVWGGTARLGMQWMPEKSISFGLSMLAGKIFNHTRDIQNLSQAPDQTGNFIDDTTFTYGDGIPIPSALPLNFRLGAAWFPSKDLLIAADLIADIGSRYFENQGLRNTINAALGIEYYLAPIFPVRLGLFTNRANTPEIIPGKTGQPMHTNLLGFSLGVGWQTRNSSISLSMSYQGGSGQMQVSGDDPAAIQEVSISKLAVALTGSARY